MPVGGWWLALADIDAVFGGAVVVTVLILLLPYILVLVALWRMGTGLLGIRAEMRGVARALVYQAEVFGRDQAEPATVPAPTSPQFAPVPDEAPLAPQRRMTHPDQLPGTTQLLVGALVLVFPGTVLVLMGVIGVVAGADAFVGWQLGFGLPLLVAGLLVLDWGLRLRRGAGPKPN